MTSTLCISNSRTSLLRAIGNPTDSFQFASTNPTKSNPWYNDECKEAIKTRKKALNKFKKFPTKDNLNEVKVFRAKARRTIKISKRKSWRSYVSKINHKTPIKKVWDMIRKISGKTKSPSYTHLNHPVAETKSTSKFDIAETLGETFLNNSCSRNYSEKIKKLKQNKKKLNLILSLQILRNIIIILILMNFWMQLNNHMILQLGRMKYIIKCLNISQRVPSKLF